LVPTGSPSENAATRSYLALTHAKRLLYHCLLLTAALPLRSGLTFSAVDSLSSGRHYLPTACLRCRAVADAVRSSSACLWLYASTKEKGWLTVLPLLALLMNGLSTVCSGYTVLEGRRAGYAGTLLDHPVPASRAAGEEETGLFNLHYSTLFVAARRRLPSSLLHAIHQHGSACLLLNTMLYGLLP